MDKIKKLSIRKTILLYQAISLVCSFFLSALVMQRADYIQTQIWIKYVDMNQYLEAVEGEARENGVRAYMAEIPRPNAAYMSRTDHAVSEVCDFLQTYTVLLFSIVGSCVAVFLFYKHKLQKPLKELEQASARISQNDLDFQITYENQDEMGHLCLEFERMREQLAQNNQAWWRMMEEERALRAAIAHDIRSPLSVLKGYQEMLLEFLPQGELDLPQTMEMLTESRKQVQRMDAFVETMRKMNSLEQRELLPRQITAEAFRKAVQAELEILGLETEKHITLQMQKSAESFCGDEEIILEVLENLLSNALRYAKEQIEIVVFFTEQELKLSVKDDGQGFQEEAEEITKMFHQQNLKDSLKHAGMGMYISRLYCEKHGGNLLLENQKTGGAAVTALFRRIV